MFQGNNNRDFSVRKQINETQESFYFGQESLKPYENKTELQELESFLKFFTSKQTLTEIPSSSNNPSKLVSESKPASQLKFTSQSKNIIPSNSPALTLTMKRSFSRKTKNNSIGAQKIQSNFVGKNTSIKNSSTTIDNMNQKTTSKWTSKLENQTYQDKAKNKNITPQSIQKQAVSKSKVNSMINPEESKINFNISTRNSTRLQMLNTRKSKLQTDINKKNTLNGLQQEKIPLIKSKNINIHQIKNSNSKKTQEKGQKVQQKKPQLSTQLMKQQSEKERQQNEQKKTESGSGSKQYKNTRQKQSQIAYIECLPQESVQISQHYPNYTSRHSIHQFQSQQLSLSDIESKEQENNFSSHQTNIEQIHQPIQHQRPNILQPQSLLQLNQTNQEVTNQQHTQNNLNLTSLIANTQDIIDFINRLNLRNRTQPFDLMVGQLVQLNLIAQQVQELGQIGNNLGYSLVNVFGTRIRELQTTIISQVGQALLVSFSERMDPQFQALVMRQPSLRNGFSKAEIEKSFEQKMTVEQVECSICLQNIKGGQSVIELQCYHGYHPICIKTWLQNSKKCPMCRNQQKRKQI